MDFVHQNFWLILMALASGIMLVFPDLFGKLSGVAEVDVTQAVQLINHDNALVLDVREHNEFNDGHIANARLIPLGQLKDSVQTLEKYRDQPIVINCRSGKRSATACALLSKAGFSRVYNLTGSILAWQRSKMPTVK